MKRAAIALSCLTLAAQICLLPTQVSAQPATNQTGSGAAVRISADTQKFIQQVTISDLFELATARLALARGTDAQKAFANRMIEDHGKTSAELKRFIVVGKVDIDVPSQLDSAHQGKYDALNNARGEEFTALYTAQQVEAHNQAIALFERYAANGDNAELKEWAANTVPALKHHLQMAQALDRQGGQAAAPASK
ncbi:conserved hypothetical protein [Rhodopseudomonas palustris HaA2]|uniref:DUF4142 domain-containing protein n=1 Tax=Rhodopseudomonas palustris (strain HaA2) TaxID=316058 RepID=Q2IZZ6_RHOP2|nr:DUF4142 domain-containing protein [Rhodopseudomonas palustris]ABD06214.1 conserved hypothetical protein [Rhodopseudomonas palustris HaA2]